MVTKNKRNELIGKSLKLLKKAHIIITPREAKCIETADFGLSEPEHTGLQLVVYLNTDRCCAKELILLSKQTCPQHKHPPVAGKPACGELVEGVEPGKEETFRCRWGKVYLYVEGKSAAKIKCKPPKGSEKYYTVRHQIILNPGQQYTLAPDTWHWFQAGPKGAVVSEFSTKSRDEFDIFLDPRIQRKTVIAG
jgi:D-lyxose ketol-isomerase